MNIAVASGKGGTGKTTVSVNLAASAGVPVRLVDCDVEEPNAHLFSKPVETGREAVTHFIPSIDFEKCTGCGTCESICRFSALVMVAGRLMEFPEMCHGCKGCLLACPNAAISEGARVLGEIIQAKADGFELAWGSLRIGEAMSPPLIEAVRRCPTDLPRIIDAPPGTSCPMIAAIRDTDFVLLVTEPTPFGLHDLALAADAVKSLGLPCGIIENRAEEGNRRVADFAEARQIPLLLSIPFKREYAETCSRGGLLVEADPDLRDRFQTLWQTLGKMTQEEVCA